MDKKLKKIWFLTIFFIIFLPIFNYSIFGILRYDIPDLTSVEFFFIGIYGLILSAIYEEKI